MMELGVRSNGCLKQDKSRKRRAPKQNPQSFGTARKQKFAGVKSKRSCHVHLSIRMVRFMEAPEKRNTMIKPMPSVIKHVKQNNRGHNFGQAIKAQSMRQTPFFRLHVVY